VYSVQELRIEIIQMLSDIGMLVPSDSTLHSRSDVVYYCFPEAEEDDLFGLKIIRIYQHKILHYITLNTTKEFYSIDELKTWVLSQWTNYINWI
jgi:hypothetical protein